MGRPLLTLLVACLVVMGSPGPSTVSATAMGAAYGIGRSLRYVGGLIAGTGCVLLAVAMGVVAVVLANPLAARVLPVIGAGYVVYLAWQIATAPPLRERGGPDAAPAFAGGFLLAIANPKAYLAIAAVFAGTVVVADDPGRDAMVKIIVLSLMIVLIHLGWLLVGVSLARVLRDPVWARVVNVTLAVALVAMTIASLLG
jgi:threonine/homoserine/homoserine lactone efflux protein